MDKINQLCQLGIIDIILSILQAFPDSKNVIKYGCLTLLILGSNNTMNVDLIGLKGGCEMVTKLLSDVKLTYDIELFEIIIRFVNLLATWYDNRLRLVSNGCGEVLVKSMLSIFAIKSESGNDITTEINTSSDITNDIKLSSTGDQMDKLVFIFCDTLKLLVTTDESENDVVINNTPGDVGEYGGNDHSGSDSDNDVIDDEDGAGDGTGDILKTASNLHEK